MVNRRQFIKSIGGAALAVPATGLVAASPADKTPDNAPFTGEPLLLNQNENTLGMSPRAKKAATAALAYGHRYPDDMVGALAKTLASLHGIDTTNVLVGNGSTGLLNAVMNSLAGPGTLIVAPTPTYNALKRIGEAAGATYRTVPTGPGFAFDLAGLESHTLRHEGPVIVYIVTPNNPTGLLAATQPLFDWIRRAPDNVFFVIDEAYHDYVADPAYRSAIRLVGEGHKNLFVARTFSKLHAMAGMRVGYGFLHGDVARQVKNFYAAWNVSLPGVAAALASLEDSAWQEKSILTVKNGKKILAGGLDALGLGHIPSQANFMLHEIRGAHSDFHARMKEGGILVGRDMNTGPGWVRVSIGTGQEMIRYTDRLLQFRERGWL